MIMQWRGTAGLDPIHLSTGDRVRVASGVFGNSGRIRSISAGHILVHYDHGGREVIDPTRRPVWFIGASA
ncbi:hypothetical protein FHT40_006021 [Mycolicibacterium sp. BK556]|uniref:hypothetical protein n=1 Tax=Mycobacterium sp. BK086 TaxID=2512165 RepID=UPI0010611A23|nr:hypothetical protein [Mycobacterium sp. BK086]MBB3606332.1 hypothetical protein [Mycolicibacterium sp. BK556]MBB3632911.1 hypothetical protein [Mycolicibacterium sp. BK607]MBB3754494.1 hypothetical protein [Mycolicibacterium sp. BK634]TDO17771.1 hypothetical protein EV580_0949 [Mycobacterium sp. BK086]